jgi:hypothetical protein
MIMNDNYLDSVKKQFSYYKMLGEKAIAQVPEDRLAWQYNEESNSISAIVKHLWGNMMSRWTGFLDTDGEKEWRDRDSEFDNDVLAKQELMDRWNQGWKCLFDAIDPLTGADLSKIIYIRNMGHTVMEAINRQLAHYAYHVGQIVFLGKMLCDGGWTTLSIPRGNSKTYNEARFAKPRHNEHFTDEFLGDKKGQPGN